MIIIMLYAKIKGTLSQTGVLRQGGESSGLLTDWQRDRRPEM